MPEVNISLPSEEWKNKIQNYAIELSNIRYKIDMGEYHLIREYHALIKGGVRNLLGWFKEKEPDKIKELQTQTRVIRGISEQVNPFIGNSSYGITNEFNDFISKLDEIEQILRNVMRRENFLVKVSEKNVRLT